jgi:hypothetical protein
VVAKVMKSLSARKQAAQKTDVERFNLKILSELEGRKELQFDLSNRLTTFEYLNDSEGINRVWENIQENIKISAKEILCLCRRKHH